MRHFNYHEFDCPMEGKGSGERMMDDTFLDMLDRARAIAGISFVITSGYRCEAENRRCGGVKDSAHMKGLAADIRCRNSRERAYIVGALIDAGFHRIGLGDGFVHCDADETKDEDVIWLYT